MARGGYAFVWQGSPLLRAIQEAQREGMQARAQATKADLQGSIHVDTGDMRDKAFAEVEQRGNRLVLRAGSDSDHAVYEELGTSRRPGHPVIRSVVDRQFPNVGRDIASALARRAAGFFRRRR